VTLSLRGRRYFERVVILFEFDTVPIKEAFTPEEDWNIGIDEDDRRIEALALVPDVQGEFADEAFGAFHRDADGGSFGTPIAFNAEYLCYGGRHGDLVSAGVDKLHKKTSAPVKLESALLDWRRARPAVLRNGVGPCRA
jgi:hypothetical protein